MPAHYELELMKNFVQCWLQGDTDRIFFSHKRKSFGAVSHVAKVDNETAMTLIAHGLLELESENFCKKIYLSGRSKVSDVYGLGNFKQHNWYVKFHLEEDVEGNYLDSISFHPLDEEMKLESGQVLDVTYKEDRPWN